MVRMIKTYDGTHSFYNDEVGELYHSMSGAYEESVAKFALPCKDFFTLSHLVIFDVCFGLGYNTAAIISAITTTNPTCEITIYAYEIDTTILSLMRSIDVPSDTYPLLCDAVEGACVPFSFHLILGDVRDTLLATPDFADIVLHDPFSLKKSPDLWTKDFFALVYAKMKMNSILTTYSYARTVRQNLVSVGFAVNDGPILGRRSPSTIALKHTEFSPSL